MHKGKTPTGRLLKHLRARVPLLPTDFSRFPTLPSDMECVPTPTPTPTPTLTRIHRSRRVDRTVPSEDGRPFKEAAVASNGLRHPTPKDDRKARTPRGKRTIVSRPSGPGKGKGARDAATSHSPRDATKTKKAASSDPKALDACDRGIAEVADIYTDGSHCKGSHSKGYGAYCRHGGRDYRMAQRVDPEHMARHFGISTNNEISNPTMELAAAVRIMQMCRAGRAAFREVCMHVDYTGVEAWLTSRWKARVPYISALVVLGKRLMAELKQTGTEVRFVHVDGHSGDPGNDEADRMAKSSDECNQFGELFGVEQS